MFRVAQGVDSWRAWQDVAIADSMLRENPHAEANDRSLGEALAQVGELPPPGMSTGAEPPDRIKAWSAEEHAGDAEWQEYSKAPFDLARTVADENLLLPQAMFRSVTLNPRDVYIQPADRRRFAEWVAARRSTLARLRMALSDIARQELDFAIARGWADFVSYADIEKARSPEDAARASEELAARRAELAKLGATPAQIEESIKGARLFNDRALLNMAFCYAIRAGDDRIYLGNLARMPQSKAAANAFYAEAMSFYTDLVGFFRMEQRLGDRESAKIIESMESALARYM